MRFHSLPFSFLFSLQNRQPADTNTLCNRCEYGQRRVAKPVFTRRYLPVRGNFGCRSPGGAGLEVMLGESMVGYLCTCRRIFGAEPLRAPHVFEHATLSPTITFHSNAPSTRLLLNRLLTSAGEQRQLPLWRRVLCPTVGVQSFWGGSGEGPFSCACSYIGYAGVPQRQARRHACRRQRLLCPSLDWQRARRKDAPLP